MNESELNDAIIAACAASPEAGRAIFDALIEAEQPAPDKLAALEFAREYFCNEEFRGAVADMAWLINEPEN